jgi:hypothetical protein
MAQGEGTNVPAPQAIPHLSDTTRRQHLEERAAQLNSTLSSGRIIFVGQLSSGEFSVEYNVPGANMTYVSQWPGWAFELAKAALLYDKEVWVLSNGDPLGDNLVEVLILR